MRKFAVLGPKEKYFSFLFGTGRINSFFIKISYTLELKY